MTIPLLDVIDIHGKNITADVLLTQRSFAAYLVDERHAHYHFTIKGNQPQLLLDIALHFEGRQQPDFVEKTTLAHRRIETRSDLDRYRTEQLSRLSLRRSGLCHRTRSHRKKQPGNDQRSSPTALSAPLSKQTPNGYPQQNVATGASRTAVITSYIGSLTRTVA